MRKGRGGGGQTTGFRWLDVAEPSMESNYRGKGWAVVGLDGAGEGRGKRRSLCYCP